MGNPLVWRRIATGYQLSSILSIWEMRQQARH
jgi:hypothetical protein